MSKWIPVKYRPAEGNELKRYAYMFTCPMPDDEEEILISMTTSRGKRKVRQDVNYIDDGYHLDSEYDWLDVDAWMPLPAPYKEDHDETT